MKRFVFSFVLCLTALTNSIFAADKVTISDFLIILGDTDKELFISLDNETAYAGFQFDLYLPDGLSVSSYSAEKRLPEATALSMNRQADGAYRFIYADINKSNIYLVSDISGTSGNIIKIKVSATNNASIGKVEGHFKNIKLSKRNGEGNTYQEMSFPVKILASLTVTARNYTRVYGEPNPTFEYVVEGGELIGTPEITCIATPATPIGTYDISISQGSVTNDVVEYVNGTLTVEKAPLTIAAGNYTIKQGEPMPEFTLTYTGFKNNENESILTKPVIISCNANAASEPGEYPITLSGAKAVNYDISYTNGKLIVTQAYTPGDVNGDGEVNVADLVAVSNYMAGDERVSKEKADVNSDGEVNVADLVAISNIMSGNAE